MKTIYSAFFKVFYLFFNFIIKIFNLLSMYISYFIIWLYLFDEIINRFSSTPLLLRKLCVRYTHSFSASCGQANNFVSRNYSSLGGSTAGSSGERSANIEKVCIDGKYYYFLSPLTQLIKFNKDLNSIFNGLDPAEIYDIEYYVYLWTNDVNKSLLNFDGRKRILHSVKYNPLFNDYIVGLSIFECYASIW
jgi:hypothetical protein